MLLVIQPIRDAVLLAQRSFNVVFRQLLHRVGICFCKEAFELIGLLRQKQTKILLVCKGQYPVSLDVVCVVRAIGDRLHIHFDELITSLRNSVPDDSQGCLIL